METKDFTVADLIEFLKTQDQDAMVLIYGNDDDACSEMFNPELHSHYTDYRGNKHVNPTAPYYNKRYLLLGGG